MVKQSPPLRVAILYGGRSLEHEISVITALQAIEALDSALWDPYPVYVAPSGCWYTGKELLDRSFYPQWAKGVKQLQRLYPTADPTLGGFLAEGKRGRLVAWKVEVCLLAFHGGVGENGSVQGLLEMARIPYTSCGVTSSAIAMDKWLCKQLLGSWGIPSLPALSIPIERLRSGLPGLELALAQILGANPYPLMIKPRHLGSSIGVGKATNFKEVRSLLCQALRYDKEALIEPYLEELLEINVAVRQVQGQLEASAVEVPLPSGSEQPLSYEDKYLRGGSKKGARESQGMADLMRSIDPVDLDPELKKHAQEIALEAFEWLGCSGIVRFDFLFDLKEGRLFFNELNALPGSLSYYLWEKDFLYTDLLDELLREAIRRHGEKLCFVEELPWRALLSQ